MANFNWYPVKKADDTPLTGITYTQRTSVFNQQIWGSNAPGSLLVMGTIDDEEPSSAVSASGSQVTSSSGLLFTTTTAHGFSTGLTVQFTTSTTLPTGISLATNYFAVVISPTAYKVATSLANALAATVVAYTNTGTGNQTATPTPLDIDTIVLQGSYDGQNWITVPNFSNTGAPGTLGPWTVRWVDYPAYSLLITVIAGQFNINPCQIGFRGGS